MKTSYKDMTKKVTSELSRHLVKQGKKKKSNRIIKNTLEFMLKILQRVYPKFSEIKFNSLLHVFYKKNIKPFKVKKHRQGKPPILSFVSPGRSMHRINRFLILGARDQTYRRPFFKKLAFEYIKAFLRDDNSLLVKELGHLKQILLDLRMGKKEKSPKPA